MKKIVYLIFIILVFTACRTNNGDIGPLYGQWIMQSMTVNDQQSSIDVQKYNWRFQNNIVIITEPFGIQEYASYAGTWQLDDNKLYLDFTHTNASGNNNSYTPPAELHLSRGINTLTVDKLSGKDMILSFDDEAGQRITFRLKKLI